VDISERGEVWERNKKEKRERMRRELEQKRNKNCTFVPKIKRFDRSKSANQKRDYNTSAFLKEGLNNYFQRIDRANKMKKGFHNNKPPPLERKVNLNKSRRTPSRNQKRKKSLIKSKHDDSKYESRFKPMQMQKTEEEFFNSNQEQLFGSSKYKENNLNQHSRTKTENSGIRNEVLQDLSRREIQEGSPPSSYSTRIHGPNMFAAQTKQLIQGLFSSNETGSLGLLGSKYGQGTF
jgi:hypothetical protein